MIVYPNAKINLGLNVLKKREDGYHEISSVFYPLFETVDILEIKKSENFSFCSTGIEIPKGKNLCEKAWTLLQNDFGIGNVKIHLHKQIPIGGGLGGGSSNASFTLKVLDKLFKLKLTNKELKRYALKLGADCPFFIDNEPKKVKGIGEKMTKFDLDLSNYKIKLINPEIHISTKEAYNTIKPRNPEFSINKIIQLPIREWKNYLRNDFEESIIKKYPVIKEKKEELYKNGAVYASMTGSGSVLYGIFNKKK